MSITNRKKKDLHPVKIVSNKEIEKGIFIVDIERSWNFIPGQVIAVAMSPDDEPRLYSIASGINSPYFSILFDVKPDGVLTPSLSKTKPGDLIYISEPFGKFIDLGEPGYWIATGTGIAPFISMMESGLSSNKTLLHGARELRQFYLAEKFIASMGSRYLRFCTAETANDVISGRLTNYLKNSDTLLPDRKYYLCGNPEMVVGVRDVLINKGIPFDNILAEIYF